MGTMSTTAWVAVSRAQRHGWKVEAEVRGVYIRMVRSRYYPAQRVWGWYSMVVYADGSVR
jgi:hypothetical protein